MKTLATLLYSLSGIVIVAMYIPQAISAFRAKGEGISLVAWAGWSITSLSASLYAWFVVQDLLFFALSCFNVIGCVTILSSRYLYRRHLVES